MKAVILAGGYGTRLSEETAVRPKPMVEIGGKPMLWHIMKVYSAHGIHDFIICCGYKGYVIKEYFANYFLHVSNVTFDMEQNRMEVHQSASEPWRVTLVDTGTDSGTGGRLRYVRDFIGDEDFCFTYGDGISNVDITKLIAFHRSHDSLATLTTVQPAHRFGTLRFEGDRVTNFVEKAANGGWINGGFFVLSPKVIDYIDDDRTMWEAAPMQRLVKEGQVRAFVHEGFWYSMDTLRDKRALDELWNSGKAPWKIW